MEGHHPPFQKARTTHQCQMQQAGSQGLRWVLSFLDLGKELGDPNTHQDYDGTGSYITVDFPYQESF
jgi:hypothetical protein